MTDPTRARDEVLHALASLVAAHSLLKRAFEAKKPPNKVVGSDSMFRQMLADYEKSIKVGRAAIATPRPPDVPQDVVDGLVEVLEELTGDDGIYECSQERGRQALAAYRAATATGDRT